MTAQERKAFEAIREALRDLLMDAENDHTYPCGLEVCEYCERIDKARAALALAEEVNRGL